MPQRVYIVEGNTGIYEDYCDWAACVCATKRTAEARARKLNKIAKGHKHYRFFDDRWEGLEALLKAAGDEYPRRPDSRGIEYTVVGPFTLAHHA